jgi:hypothetical protein
MQRRRASLGFTLQATRLVTGDRLLPHQTRKNVAKLASQLNWHVPFCISLDRRVSGFHPVPRK